MDKKIENEKLDKDIVISVEKAASLLNLFKDGFFDELSIKEINEKLSVPKTTAFRLVNTLVRSDFLEQNEENKKYKLGVNIRILGERYLSTHTLEKIGHLYLEKIVKKSGESASISIFDNNETVIVDKVNGLCSIRVVNEIGVRNPLHCSGSGKVFLGFLKEDECRRVIDQISPLKAYTPYTITDKEKLFENVRIVQQQGYVYDDQEIHMGQICISAPVYDRSNKVCAAITVSGPRERIIEKGIENIGQKLAQSCNQMSREMGCTLNMD